MKAKTKRLLKKTLYVGTYFALICLTILIGNAVFAILVSTLFGLLLVGMLYRDYRLGHADHKEKKAIHKQMQVDKQRYYPKGRNFADATLLEYEKEKVEKEKKRLAHK
jgi:hypothetical protein